jgi:Rieske Fe-S protein
MPEDQERFEDYLELEHYIDELQAGHVAHPPESLTPDQARIYRMAALFRSAGPEGAEPRPEFAEELQAHLEREMELSGPTQKMAVVRDRQSRQARDRPGRVSRRALLTGGAAVAASMVVGAGVERVVEQAVQGPTPKVPVLPSLIAKGTPTAWFFVTTVAELGNKAVRFATDTIIGYVIRADKDADAQDRGKIIAMSAACTHMGCIVQWQSADRKFNCPCHGRQFTEYGKIDNAGPGYYVYPLPRLETKIIAGKIYVKVPTGPGQQSWDPGNA